MTNKILFSSSLATVLILIISTEPSFKFLHKGIFNNYEEMVLEPLFIFAVAFFISSIILLFFSGETFSKWLSGFVSWYGPLSIILIMTGTTGSSYAWFSRSDIATFLGIVLVAVTLVFALMQKFVYKK